MISLKKIAAILSVLVLISFMAGCGGGGGGGDEGGGSGTERVAISGTADDGTLNSPISGAECAFVDLNGDRLFGTTADNFGRFSIKVPPDVEGYIRCAPPDMPKLVLSTFSDTKGMAPGDKISGEDVTPATTLVADIINSENAAVPMARKLELLDAIENDEDPELRLLVDLCTRVYNAMLDEQLNVRFGGDDGVDGPGEGLGGGVGGDAGDGADFSPIPNARCEFVAMELEGEDLFAPDLKEGEVLFDAALADFCNDGMVNRPDLEAIAEQVNQVFEGRQTEIMAAIANRFSECIGQPYRTTADGEDSETPGRYFLPIPPNVQGFVRCSPPNQPKLKLATFVSTEGLSDGDKIPSQDVTPATTFFSHSIVTKLSEDLMTVKENYLDNIAGLEDIQIKKDGEMITRFELKETADPNDDDVGLVAFSATSLFNILYKNEMDVDYLAALDGFIDKKEVDPEDLESLDIPKEDAEKWAEVVNTSNDTAGDELGTNLNEALSTARIKVKVTDRAGGDGLPGAEVDITGAPSGVVCEDCPAVSDNNGEVILTLTGVDTEAILIEVEASSVAGFEPTTRTTQVVAFSTVDLEIPFSYKLTVQGGGTGNGTVTSSPTGISCDISGGVASGDDNAVYESGTEVALTAQPSEGSTFDGWSDGGCSGTGDCTVTMNQAHTVIAAFILTNAQQTGSLSVTITPSGAVSAGAQWRVDGGSWRNSGYTQSGLSVGSHTVEFGDVSGWTKPVNQSVTINANQTTSASGNYTQQTGSLSVTITPSGAVSAGAQWRVDGGSWRNSGYTQSGLSVGSHTVEFRDVSGWTKPGNVTVTIIANQTTTISQAYQITNPVPPEIFTISYQTAGTSDTCIDSSGETFTGTLINVTFNYEDPNGDGHKNDGAKVWAFGNFDATNFSTFNGDGFAGSITSHLCYRFGESTSVNIQMQLEDGADNLSNSLTINVPKPPGGA